MAIKAKRRCLTWVRLVIGYKTLKLIISNWNGKEPGHFLLKPLQVKALKVEP